MASQNGVAVDMKKLKQSKNINCFQYNFKVIPDILYMYPEYEATIRFRADQYNNHVIQSQQRFILAVGMVTYTLTAPTQKVIPMTVLLFYHLGYMSTNLYHFLAIH